ncbi:MAG: sigma-54-dependent Fis family transcriptional regulator [Pyrinomonadaceae bacterium]|nr:sigma-54-dependent Fis family transcriptional regulator [Phycisphaerales bacterium]
MPRILVIEDEKSLRVSISRMLTRSGYEVSEAEGASEAAGYLKQQAFDLVITDVNLGDGNGMELIQQARADGFDGVAVVITAFGTIATAVEAMKHGADDFLQKPLRFEELPLQVEKWLEKQRLTRRLNLYERLERSREESSAVIGQSKAWADALRLADRLASMPLSPPSDDEGITLPAILLIGETGSGKGVMARYIHQQATANVATGSGEVVKSPPPPFVHVNCSALPPTLVESELFGHEKGAFTDAREARAGLFEMADGGTIFLDEISEMPLELQAKLLLVVEQGKFRRVGGAKDRTVQVRVIAASNVDLAKRVEAGGFRRDLWYRLNAFTIRIPALRHRDGDALRIAESALAKFTKRYARSPMRLSDAAKHAVTSSEWPGNVRELINTIQRVAMLCEKNTVEPEDLGLTPAETVRGVPVLASRIIPHSQPDYSAEDAHNTLELSEAAIPFEGGTSLVPIFEFDRGIFNAEAIEKELLSQALKHTRGNVSRAAKLIGLTRASMRYRMERYGLHHLEPEVANK